MIPELLYQLALSQVPHIGYVHAKILIERFGSASEIFNAPQSELEKLEGIGEIRGRSIKNFRDFSKAEKEIKFIERFGISCKFFADKQYPRRLLNCFDPPTMLFYKGAADLNALRIVAIVGTRNHTEYGKSVTEKLVKALISTDCIIVSGLAFGIDSIAHNCALKYDLRTIGVVGHGLDTIYPQQHSNLARQMISEGGLLTEFTSHTKPDKHNFPSRNRVVAGISDATIVVESGLKGGSLITAEIADSYHRDVFAVPGRTTDAKSAGCNQLIKNNRAVLLQDPEQFIEIMDWGAGKAPPAAVQRKLFANLSEEEMKIVDLLKISDSLSMDELIFNGGLQVSKLASILLNLELTGVVKVLSGKRYRLND